MLVKYLSRYDCSLDNLTKMLGALTITDEWLVRTSPEQFAIDSQLNWRIKDCDEEMALKQSYRTQSCSICERFWPTPVVL